MHNPDVFGLKRFTVLGLTNAQYYWDSMHIDLSFSVSVTASSIKANRQRLLPETTYTESDGRPSAIAVGICGIIFIALEVLIFLICDIPLMCRLCKVTKRNQETGN